MYRTITNRAEIVTYIMSIKDICIVFGVLVSMTENKDMMLRLINMYSAIITIATLIKSTTITTAISWIRKAIFHLMPTLQAAAIIGHLRRLSAVWMMTIHGVDGIQIPILRVSIHSRPCLQAM